MRAIAFALLIAAAGCSGSSSSDPAPPAHGTQIKSPDYTLAAGEEKYMCLFTHLDEPADVAITSFKSWAGAQVHHLEVFQALEPEPDGFTECPDGGSIKMTWMPLFGGGVNVGGLDLPPGAGFKLPKNATLLVQLHLLNATQAPVTQKLVVNMDYAADATQVTPAGIFAFGSTSIDLPAGATGMQIQSSCTLPKDMNVFAVQPHMHTLGTKLEFELGSSETTAQMAYKRDPWTFGGQPIDSMTMQLSQGQFGRVTCTYDNTTDHEVTYGESTTNEMCFFVLFYTPFDKLGGCVN